MSADESTQTNGVPGTTPPLAISAADVAKRSWTVESALAATECTYEENTDSPVPFFHLLQRLKTTQRTGWIRFHVSNGESIADHMYRMSIITMFAPVSVTYNINMAKCNQMALVHDMAESLVGDITPVDGVAKEDKSQRESDTMDYICERLLGKVNNGLTGDMIRKLWQEYEDSETMDSKFVHDVDKFELILQMYEYERDHHVDLGEFTHVFEKIQLPEMQAWAREVLQERKKLWEKRPAKPTWAPGIEP